MLYEKDVIKIGVVGIVYSERVRNTNVGAEIKKRPSRTRTCTPRFPFPTTYNSSYLNTGSNNIPRDIKLKLLEKCKLKTINIQQIKKYLIELKQY